MAVTNPFNLKSGSDFVRSPRTQRSAVVPPTASAQSSTTSNPVIMPGGQVINTSQTMMPGGQVIGGNTGSSTVQRAVTAPTSNIYSPSTAAQVSRLFGSSGATNPGQTSGPAWDLFNAISSGMGGGLPYQLSGLTQLLGKDRVNQILASSKQGTAPDNGTIQAYLDYTGVPAESFEASLNPNWYGWKSLGFNKPTAEETAAAQSAQAKSYYDAWVAGGQRNAAQIATDQMKQLHPELFQAMPEGVAYYDYNGNPVYAS